MTDLLDIDIEEELKAIKQHRAGRSVLRTTQIETTADAASIRHRLGVSQDIFATLLGVSVKTVRNWEQGIRKPRGPAQALLRIVDKNPETLFT